MSNEGNPRLCCLAVELMPMQGAVQASILGTLHGIGPCATVVFVCFV